MHQLSPYAFMLLLSSFCYIDRSALFLLGEQRGSDQVCRSSQLDTDDPLDLAQQLLVWHRLSRLDIGNLSLALVPTPGGIKLTSFG
jgi:hypothetical protein